MHEKSVELVNRAVAAINETYSTGDMGPFRRHLEETFEPDVVLAAPGGAFLEGEWRGHDGAVGFVANQMEVLEDMWLRVDEILLGEPDALVVAVAFGGRARYSGLEVELHPFHEFRLRDGKVTRWQIFFEREQALAAARAARGQSDE
ncbi:MAG: nuclear transport factor 2 family protein [Thermoleophilaceae bacterium]